MGKVKHIANWPIHGLTSQPLKAGDVIEVDADSLPICELVTAGALSRHDGKASTSVAAKESLPATSTQESGLKRVKIWRYSEKIDGKEVSKELRIIQCPGCECEHALGHERAGGHKWNGSFVKPTFEPSLLWQCPGLKGIDNYRCHSFVREGRIEFLSDCTHAFAGRTVELPQVREDE